MSFWWTSLFDNVLAYQFGCCVSLCLHVCSSFSIILPDCLCGSLPVLHSSCWSSCVQIHPWVSPKNKIACQRKSSWQGDGSEVLLPSLVCSSILLTFHIYGISIYSVGAAFLPCILFGPLSKSRDKGDGDTGDKSTLTGAALTKTEFTAAVVWLKRDEPQIEDTG